MTMTLPVTTITVSGVGGFRGLRPDSYEQTKIVVNYNTDGTFNLSQPHDDFRSMPYGGPSVGLTLPMFEEVIRAFEETPRPRDFYQPFYRGTFGPFGMMLSPVEVFGYFLKDKAAMVLERRTLTWDKIPSRHIEQISLTLEEFKQCRDACRGYRGYPFAHLDVSSVGEFIFDAAVV